MRTSERDSELSSATEAKPRASTQEMFDQTAELEITPALWQDVIEHPGVKEIFHDLDVADEDLEEMFDVMDVDNSGTIDLAELVEGTAKLRGDARRSDIASMFFMMKQMQQEVHQLAETVVTLGMRSSQTL